MTAPESHDNNVVEEQRVIQQAMDTLLDIHREHDEGGYPLDIGVDFLCQHVILNHHDPSVRNQWDEFFAIYDLGGEE